LVFVQCSFPYTITVFALDIDLILSKLDTFKFVFANFGSQLLHIKTDLELGVVGHAFQKKITLLILWIAFH